MQRELDKAWEALPGRTLIQTRDFTGQHGIIYKDDHGRGTYLMTDHRRWSQQRPIVGRWKLVGEVQDFVVLATNVDPCTGEQTLMALCGYQRDESGKVVPIK